MKRRTPVLALLGGTVVCGVVLASRRRRKRPKPAIGDHRYYYPDGRRVLRVVPGLIVIATPAIWGWDFAGLAGGIWDGITTVGADIRDWVLRVVDFAIDKALNIVHTITEGITDLVNKVGDTLGLIADEVASVSRAVVGVAKQTLEWVDGTFDNFRQQLKDFLEHAWDDLKRWVIDNFPDWIGGVFGDLWDFLKAIFEIGLDGVRFLINLIDDPIDFLWDLLRDIVGDAIDAALDLIDFVGDGAEAIVRAGLNLIFGALGDFVDIITKIWHILEWLAEHVDDITIDVLENIFTVDPQAFGERILNAVDDNSDRMESLFARWL